MTARRDERGQMMPLAAVLVVFLVIGFWALVSAGQAWTARRDAYAVAADAAAAGAQASFDALRGGSPSLDPDLARERASGVIAAAGYRGSVRVTGQEVHVSVSAAVGYSLPSPGMPAVVTGTASARAQQGVSGAEGG